MNRLFPLFECGRLYGADLTGKHHCRGISLTVQWLGMIIDFNIGRVSTRQNGGVQ